eukprot:PITA_11833
MAGGMMRCSGAESVQTYIVHLSDMETEGIQHSDRRERHSNLLGRVTGDPAGSRILYSYESVINGFSARLSESEILALQSVDGFVAAYPDRILNLHTTYSYRFLQLDSLVGKLWPASGFGEGTIIGVLDTGVWPESPSFRDDGMPGVPERWRGGCQSGPRDFNASHCNKKLIGARFFNSGHQAGFSEIVSGGQPEYESPRDSKGHGTHTASTAAGNTVIDANLLSNAKGIARGMAPSAHVAMYKVCWDGGCYSSDILAGMDAAISDGVDVISLSIGGFSVPFYEDSIAIGAFRATERGVFVACAAGNNGPFGYSVSNEAPWIMTVGAGTVDRNFPAKVRLGNGQVLYGESLYDATLGARESLVPIVYAGDAGIQNNSKYCFPETLNPAAVAGKMVVCDLGSNARAEKGEVVRKAGGVGMILAGSQLSGEATAAEAHVLPATQVGYAEANIIKKYVNSSANPRAAIHYGGTVYRASRAPAVASFSSRGPSTMNPEILKPDVIAPGVNILAAWPLNLAPSGLPTDKRRVEFNVVSGTSMACPHVAGVAALLKSLHPKWSPAAIKSALMTTADIVDNRRSPIMDTVSSRAADIFATGAGHINPGRAADPGLIYDIDVQDYLGFLCTLQYTDSQIRVIANKKVKCSNFRNYTGTLNYPSLTANFNLHEVGHGHHVTSKRWVTNVGTARSIYLARVIEPTGVTVKVQPTKLEFTELNQKLAYTVTFINNSKNETLMPPFSSGSVTWVHQGNNHGSIRYRVRSPIAVTWST